MPIFYTGASGLGTGAHLDFRVHDVEKGAYVDPTGFQNILMSGDKPLVDQFSMTSPYGTRSAPVAGARTVHQGIEYANPAGTPVSIQRGKDLKKFNDEKGGRISQYGFERDGKKYEAILLHGSDQNKILSDSAVTDGVSRYTGAAVPPPSQQDASILNKKVDAKQRAQDYANMSKSEINAAYDAIRNTPGGAAEGMKMHKAFFKK